MVAKKPRVVVVGAGMAGLTAAHQLHAAAASAFDLCVVEAGDRIGGRIRSSEFAGVRVEMGATWIHGIGGSPVYDLARELGALESTVPWERMDGSPEDPVTVAEGGHLVNPSLVSNITSFYRSLMDLARSGSVPIPANAAATSELSVGAYLRQGLKTYRAARVRDSTGHTSIAHRRGCWTLESLEEAVFAINEDTERNDTSADELTGLDLAAEGEYRAFPGDQITIAQGYSRVIEHLASALPPGMVRLGKKVEQIQWDPHGSPSASDGDDPPVRIHFEDGTAMTADHVILTVSLGVLKAAVRKHTSPSGLFSPSLPPFKREAITRLGFGVVDKLFMELDGGESEYPARFPFLQLAFEQQPLSSRRVAKIPRWIRRTPSICPVYGGSHVLLAWFVGKEAMELESLGCDEIICGIQATLDGFSARPEETNGDARRCCNGDAGGWRAGGSKVVRVMKSVWGSDPLFLGSYSYVAVGSSGKDLDLMAEPLPRCHGGGRPLQILFAGEATHRTHYSTTHGAYYSGEREANRLLQHYGYSCSS